MVLFEVGVIPLQHAVGSVEPAHVVFAVNSIAGARITGIGLGSAPPSSWSDDSVLVSVRRDEF